MWARRGSAALSVFALALTAIAALVVQSHWLSGQVLLAKPDPFINNFLSKSKNTGLSERKYVHSWVHQVKHGGLFHKLHAFEREHKTERKAWRSKQLAGITEPDDHSLYNELMRTRNRAVGAASSRASADHLQRRTDQEMGARNSRGQKNIVDFGAYRHHADAIAPKYAGKRTLPIVHHEIPKMDSKVSSLLHDLGEAKPSRDAHDRAHAQLKQAGSTTKAATSKLAAVRSGSRLPGEEIAVEQEIAAAKHAARNPAFRQAFAPKRREAGGRFRGGRIEANVEREIAAARHPAHHHLPYGRLAGHGETPASTPGAGLQRELEAARNAARQDLKMSRARKMHTDAGAEKRAVAVEDAYSMPNGDVRRSARGGGPWAAQMSVV